MKTDLIHLSVEIPADLAGSRLDQALAHLFPEHSRTRLKNWIDTAAVHVNGKPAKPKDKVYGGEQIVIEAELLPQGDWEPEAIKLQIVYEDEDLIVIDKPVGLVVHPAAGHHAGTLINALLHHAPELAQLPRAGLIHRLDKETSGLLVIARTLTAHTDLTRQLQERSIKREYFAIVSGEFTAGGTISAPMGRHPVQRKKRAIIKNGKPAVTHYRILERFRGFTSLRVNLETGRTHQIRVHMAHIHHALLGDPLYAGRPKLPKGASLFLIETLRGCKRQALHAQTLGLIHPATDEYMEWTSPLPEDLTTLLDILRKEAAA